MFDIHYLSPLIHHGISHNGMEFLEWQENTNFFNDLTLCLEKTYNEKTKILTLPKAVRDEMASIIRKHLNGTAVIQADESGNLAVDTGYLSPGVILNSKMAEKWLQEEDSKMFDAFKRLNKNVLKGTMDPKTGKLLGDFADIPFNIYINVNVEEYINIKEVEKKNTTVPQALAAMILHEVGHIYSALYMLAEDTMDNFIIAKAIKMANNETDAEKKITIINDATKILDPVTKDVIKKGEDVESGELFIVFTKVIRNRNTRRSLSLGIEEMTAEVMADMFALRMGAGRALVVGLSAIYKQYDNSTMKTFLIGLAIQLFQIVMLKNAIGVILFIITFPLSVIVYYISLIWFLISVGALIGKEVGKLDSYIYNTPYRRIKDVLREMNTRILSDKRLDSKQKAMILADAKEIEKIADENKPFFEGTGLQRFFMWVNNGNDARLKDVENYTAELIGTSLALYQDHFSKKD